MLRHSMTVGAVILLAAIAWLTVTLMTSSQADLSNDKEGEGADRGIKIVTNGREEADDPLKTSAEDHETIPEKERIAPTLVPEKNRFRVNAVTDDDGQPIEGVRIRVKNWDVDVCYADALTDSKGCAEFDLRHVDKVRYFYITGFKVGCTVEEEWLAPEDTLAELRFTTGTPLYGRVTFASSGCPAEGAIVELDQDDIWYPDKFIKTDREGRFIIPVVLERCPFDIEVALDGYATARRIRQTLNSGEEMEFLLGDGGVIEGCVRGPGQAVLAGAEVWVKKPNACRWEIEGSAHTGLDGRFRIAGFQVPGTYTVHAVADDCDFALGQSPPVRVADAQSPVQLDLTLTPRKTALTVHVIDEQGKPVNRARVEIRTMGWDNTHRICGPEQKTNYAKTDEKGFCMFAPMEPGEYRVCAGWTYGVSFHRQVTLEKDRCAEVRFELPRCMELTGKVWDSAGVPVADLNVGFWLPQIDRSQSPYVSNRMWNDNDKGQRIAGTVTDEDGCFRFERLPLDRGTLKLGHLYLPDSASMTYAQATMEGVSPEDGPLEIILPLPGVLKGRLTPPPPQGHTQACLWKYPFGITVDNLKTGEDGGFEIKTAIIDAPFTLSFEIKDCRTITLKEIKVAAGETRDLGNLFVHSGLIVEGRIVDSKGHPLIAYLCGSFTETYSDEEGRYRIRNLVEKDAYIHVEAEGFMVKNISLEDPADMTLLDITMVRPGIVEGQIVDVREDEIPKIVVVWLPILEDGSLDSECGGSSRLDPYGFFTTQLAPGRYCLTLENKNRDRLCEGPKIEIAEAERKTATFALPR
ncbi:MAG: carboxypeptidase-like regulatory domain-containing protein [Planctomycetota bacterium]